MNEWKSCNLSEVIKLIGGGTPKTTVSEYWNGNIPWLSVADFNDDNRKVYKTEKHITELGLNNSSTKLLEENDIIVSARGTVGAIAQLGVPMAFNQSCYGVKNTNDITADFLYYLMKTKINELKQKSHGSVFSTITRDTFDNIVIKLPPIETQKQIAKILSSIDDKIELNNKINDNLEKQARAISQNWESENASNLIACKIDDIAEINSNNYSSKENWQYVNYLDTSSITNGILTEIQHIDLLQEKLPGRAKRKVNPGEIVYSTVRPNQLHFGLINNPLTNMLVSTGFAVINSINPNINNEFLYLQLTKLDIIEKLQQIGEQCTSTFPAIKPSDIGHLAIPLPCEGENNMMKILKDKFSLMATNQQENQKLAKLRGTLIPKLMSGEIDVSDVEI